MIKNIINQIRGNETEDTSVESRRAYNRMNEEFASILIDGREFNIKDWSHGGVYFKGVNNNLHIDDHVNFSLKFKLPHEDILFTHSGHVVRKGADGIAISFDLHTDKSKRSLQKIMDGIVSRGFGDSSLASFE